MPKWRYRPEGNKTPVSHPTLGWLDYDGVYESSDCAENPDFVEVHDKKILADDGATAPTPVPEIEAPAPVVPAPITKSPGDTPAEAGTPGRS